MGERNRQERSFLQDPSGVEGCLVPVRHGIARRRHHREAREKSPAALALAQAQAGASREVGEKAGAWPRGPLRSLKARVAGVASESAEKPRAV